MISGNKLAADKKKSAAAKNKTISLKEVMKDPKAFGELIGAAMVANYNEKQINECFEVITNLVDNSAIKKSSYIRSIIIIINNFGWFKIWRQV